MLLVWDTSVNDLVSQKISTVVPQFNGAMGGYVSNIQIDFSFGASLNGITMATGTEAVFFDAATGRSVRHANVGALAFNLGSGVGLNGLDAGAAAANTWYYGYLISDGTTVGTLTSLSATAPTLPTNYIFKKLVSVFRVNGSTQVVAFAQSGSMISIIQTNIFTNTTGVTTYTGVDVSAAVPPIATSLFGLVGTSISSATDKAVFVACSSYAGGVPLGKSGGTVRGSTTAVENFYGSTPFDVAYRANGADTTVLWRSEATTASAYRMDISGFRIRI